MIASVSNPTSVGTGPTLFSAQGLREPSDVSAALRPLSLSAQSMSIRRLAICWLPAILWMGVIFYLSAQSRPLPKTPPTALTVVGHLAEYAVLALLLSWGQLGHGRRKRNRAWALAISFVVAILYGASDEYHQSFVAGREASWVDLGLDAAGAAVAMIVIGCWGYASRFRSTLFPGVL